jgi:steroid 5-alpha reductase family enzyme
MILFTGCTVFVLQTLGYFEGRRLGRYDIADISWGIGFILVAVTSFTLVSVKSLSGLIVLCLVIIWGVRLSTHIYARHAKTKEDNRYTALRAEWKKYPGLQIYAKIFLFQGILLMLVSLPIIASVTFGSRTQVTSIPFIVGIILWIIGLSFESIADWQLKKHISNPVTSGTLMTTGLWKYSRHPNYFGEILLWWGIWCMAIPTPVWHIALIGPITITFLITKVSGVPLAEKSLSGKSGFESYKESTSILIPWFPKKNP